MSDKLDISAKTTKYRNKDLFNESATYRKEEKRDLRQLSDRNGYRQLNNYVKMSGLRTNQNRTPDKTVCSSLYEDVGRPIYLPVPVCGSKLYPFHSVHCFQTLRNVTKLIWSESVKRDVVSTLSGSFGVTCTFQNIAVNRQLMTRALRDCRMYNCDVRGSKSLAPLDKKRCPIPTLSKLMNRTEDRDYVRNFVQELLMLRSKEKFFNSSKSCQWMNKTAIFFLANEPHNVYLHFLTYFNVFLTLNLLNSTESNTFGHLKHTIDKTDIVIIRLTETTDYRFGEFEKQLFPQLRSLSELKQPHGRSGPGAESINDVTCFRQVVTVPWAYSSFPFQLVVNKKLKSEALGCYNTTKLNVVQTNKVQDSLTRGVLSQHRKSGYGRETQGVAERMKSSLADTRLFSSIVLKACNIKESNVYGNEFQSLMTNKSPLHVLLIKRRPYFRHKSDTPLSFQRILSNEDELINAITNTFSEAVIRLKSAYMEDLDICEQVRIAHESDVIIGVHGAGLVHSWWTREGAILMELVPRDKINQPTYRVLADLTGKKYYSLLVEKASSGRNEIAVNVTRVIDILHSATS